MEYPLEFDMQSFASIKITNNKKSPPILLSGQCFLFTSLTINQILSQIASYNVYRSTAGGNHSVEYSASSPHASTVDDDELAFSGSVREACADGRTMSDVHSVLDAGLGPCLMTMLVITCHSSAGQE